MTPKSIAAVVAVAVSLVFVPLPLTAEPPARRDAGFVLDLRGTWVLEGEGPLSVGRAVPAGGSIRTPHPEPTAFITIVLLDGSTTLTGSCRVAADCAKPLLLPDRSEPDPFWVRALKAMGALLSPEDETLVPVMSRGVLGADEDVHVHDSVLKLEGGAFDLGPALRGTAAGRYTLVLEQLAPGTGTPGRPLTATVVWAPGQPLDVRSGRIGPGLYSLAVIPERDELDAPTGASAWVLLSDARRYASQARAFDEAVAIARGWSDEVRAQAVQRFLRACLQMLAEDDQRKGSSD